MTILGHRISKICEYPNWGVG